MGFLLKLFGYIIRFVGICAAGSLILLFVPNLPPYGVEFNAYNISPIMKLEGPLKLNNKLNNAERLFEHLLKGPESLAYADGTLYTGVHGGLVVAVKNDVLIPFVKFGKDCDGMYEEHICGRPLGLFIDSNKHLYVADAYYGLFKVNLSNKNVEQLIHPDTKIEGKKAKVFNSVAVANNGNIYWSDSDSNADLKNLFYSILGDGSGRLIEYDPKTKKNSVLIKNLYFANGVALADDEAFVLVAETFKNRVLRYHLKGAKKGEFDVFIDGLPGTPDNLKKDKNGNFYISLVLAKDEENTPSLILNIGQYPLLRKLIVRFVAAVQSGLSLLDSVAPSVILKKAVHAISHCETWVSVLPKIPRVTIVKVNKRGEIIDSLHATDGRISGICEIEFLDDYAYLASPFNNYLARVKLEN